MILGLIGWLSLFSGAIVSVLTWDPRAVLIGLAVLLASAAVSGVLSKKNKRI